MPYLNLKANSQPIQTFYREIKEKQQLSFLHEGAVAPHFSKLLQYCGRQFSWTLIEQYPIARKGQHPLKADGVLLDEFKLIHGVWEAKDTQDDLPTEVKKKFQAGYPQDNILFQAPDRAMLYQDGGLVIDADLTQPSHLIDTLKLFFEYQPPEYEQWELAVDEFRDKVPELAHSLLQLIEEERKYNKRFVQALDDFTELVRQAINPNIAIPAVEEMLIQHLLTERIFRRVFNNPDFTNRNIIAVEIEKVIQALTSRQFSRSEFLSKLDRFYSAIEPPPPPLTTSLKSRLSSTPYTKSFSRAFRLSWPIPTALFTRPSRLWSLWSAPWTVFCKRSLANRWGIGMSTSLIPLSAQATLSCGSCARSPKPYYPTNTRMNSTATR